MNVLRRFKRTAAVAAIALPLLFLAACPTTVDYNYRGEDLTTPLLDNVANAWNLLASVEAANNGADVYSVFYWAPPTSRVNLANMLQDAIDAAEDRRVSGTQRRDVSTALENEIRAFSNARQRGARPVDFAALQALIYEAEKLNSNTFARRADNGFHLFYFQAWVTPEDHAASGLDGQIAAAKALGAETPAAQIEAQMSELLGAMARLRGSLRRGGSTLLSGNNISTEFSAYRVASNDGTAAEGTTEATMGYHALTPANRRWESPSHQPILEVEFAFPVTIGSVQFVPFAATDEGDSGIRAYSVQFWDPATGGWQNISGTASHGAAAGDISGHNGFTAFLGRHRFTFNEEAVSTKFRFSVTEATGPVSLWEVWFNRGTETRIALADAVSTQTENLRLVWPSLVYGVNVPPEFEWVHPNVIEVFQAAIDSANEVALDPSNNRFDTRDALTAMNTAASVFDGAKARGTASGEFLVNFNNVTGAIRDARMFYERLLMAANPTATAVNVYDIHYVTTWTAIQRFRTFITTIQNDLPLMADIPALLAGLERIADEREAIVTASTPGARPTPEFIPGFNVAPHWLHATQSDVWNRMDNIGGGVFRYMDGTFGDALRNTTRNSVWSRAEMGDHPGTAWTTNTWGNDGWNPPTHATHPNQWTQEGWGDGPIPTDPRPTRSGLFPLTAEVNFGVQVPIDEIRIWFFHYGGGPTLPGSSGTRIGDMDIQYFCWETDDWRYAWRRVDSEHVMLLGASQAQFAANQTEHSHSFTFGPAGNSESPADSDAVVTSNRFKFTFRPPQNWAAVEWENREHTAGPRFFQFEFIHAGE